MPEDTTKATPMDLAMYAGMEVYIAYGQAIEVFTDDGSGICYLYRPSDLN